MMLNARKVVELTMAAVYYDRESLLNAGSGLILMWPGGFGKEFLEML